MDKIALVGDEDSALGFSLAGVSVVHSISTSEQAEMAMEQVLSRSDIGIVLLTQDSMKLLSARTQKRISDLAKPVFIEIPGKKDSSSGSESLGALIKRAMGVELK